MRILALDLGKYKTVAWMSMKHAGAALFGLINPRIAEYGMRTKVKRVIQRTQYAMPTVMIITAPIGTPMIGIFSKESASRSIQSFFITVRFAIREVAQRLS